MRVIVLGSGAREHALARALARSASVREVIVAPGNGGSDEAASAATAPIRREHIADLGGEAVRALVRREAPDLIVVGPEPPLCAGIVDELAECGVPVFGPDRSAARLEGSKAFLKEFARRHGIPTAPHEVVTDIAQAERIIAEWGAPIVVKADGLCAGKGVVVARSLDEARLAAREMLVAKKYGAAGAQVVLERFVAGSEASVHVLTDGTRHLTLPPARDYKRLGSGDVGPNTGGMGAVASADVMTPALRQRVDAEIIAPTLAGLRDEGIDFKGVLFAGIMITPQGQPMLLEYNVRFGDPECQVLMELLRGDIGRLLLSIARGALDAATVQVADGAAVTVVLAAAGYPERPQLGETIAGLSEVQDGDVVVHHGGTRREGAAHVTAGGRVLSVTARGPSREAARRKAYAACARISFAGMQLRDDIGILSEPPHE